MRHVVFDVINKAVTLVSLFVTQEVITKELLVLFPFTKFSIISLLQGSYISQDYNCPITEALLDRPITEALLDQPIAEVLLDRTITEALLDRPIVEALLYWATTEALLAAHCNFSYQAGKSAL